MWIVLFILLYTGSILNPLVVCMHIYVYVYMFVISIYCVCYCGFTVAMDLLFLVAFTLLVTVSVFGVLEFFIFITSMFGLYMY